MSDDEAKLLADIRRGEPAAWERLIARYEGRLLAFVRSRLHNESAAEDVVQEAFLGFLVSLPNYDEATPLEAFLFSITAHKLTDVLRRTGRRPMLSLIPSTDSQPGHEPVSRDRKASSLARSNEYKVAQQKVLVDCLRGLIQSWFSRGEFERPGWDKVMAVNLDSLMHICRRFKPALSEARGAIIIVSSIAGLKANKGNPAYAASKAGAISLTRTLGQAWAPDGVRVNGVAPGLVDTKLTKVTTDNPKRLAASLGAIPSGRLGTPDDMAGGVLFLASPLAAYVNGHTLVVDGGLSL